MGDLRRADQDREAIKQPEPAHAPDEVDADHEELDTSHAGRQLEMRQAFGESGTYEPERKFAGVGDQDQLWRSFEDALAGTAASRLPAIVADMDRAHRDTVALRLGEVAAVASGDVVLQIGDLVVAGAARTIDAAIQAGSKPTLARLRSYLASLEVSEVVALFQGGAGTALRAAFPVPVVQLVPQVAELTADVIASAPLLRWYLETTASETIAIAVVAGDAASNLNAALNGIGRAGWTWAFHVTAAMAAANREGITSLAEDTNQDDVRAFLQRLVAQVPAATGDATALSQALEARTLDVSAILIAAGAAGTAGVAPLERHRKELVKVATFEELVLVTLAAYVTPGTELEWWLDSPAITVDKLRDACATWGEGQLEVVAPKHFTRIASMFPDTPASALFGHRCGPIYRLARRDAKIRRWCTRHAEPLDRLRLLTEEPDDTRTLWTQLERDGIDPGWVQQLGTGDGARLRILAANCPDPTIAQWIQTRLIGDWHRPENQSNEVGAIDPIAAQDGRAHVERELDGNTETADLARRIREMSADEAAALRADPRRLEDVLWQTDASTVNTVLFKLNPPLSLVLTHLPAGANVLAYIRGRPAEETVEALSDPKIAKAAARDLGAPPLTAFAALSEPAHLKAVLKANPAVLGWILRETDAAFALEVLGDPKVAKTTAKLFEADSSLLAYLPPGELLPAAAKAALGRIIGKTNDVGVEETLDGRLTGDEEEPELAEGVEDQAEAEKNALLEPTLVGSLRYLSAQDRKGATRSTFLAVCRARSTQAKDLLEGDAHERLIGALRMHTDLSPLAVFPGLSYLMCLHGKAARKWLFETEPAPLLLSALAEDHSVLKLIIKQLDAADPGTLALIGGLPRGSALTAGERQLVKDLFDATKGGAAGRALFSARFDSTVTATFSHAELARMWPILERLPDAHVAEGMITNYTEEGVDPALGLYNNHQIRLSDSMNAPVEERDLYDLGLPLTKEQILEAFELDDATFAIQAADGRFEQVQSDAGVRYKVVSPPMERLAHTLLHEVGHAVDDMLGQQTELVYGVAGWRRYAEVDFEAMVADLGGWGAVTSEDRAAIREAWLSWINGKDTGRRGLDAIVGADHPALAGKYAGVGIVDLARKRQPMTITSPLIHRGRAWLSNDNWGQFYSVPERTLHAAPSVYGMTAPPEYFAECYADYYREYDGTPTTEGKKGGNLPASIKGWFDANIDRLGFNPRRG